MGYPKNVERKEAKEVVSQNPLFEAEAGGHIASTLLEATMLTMGLAFWLVLVSFRQLLTV